MSVQSRWPILHEWRGFPIPDLRQIPREHWLAAVRPLSGSHTADFALRQALAPIAHEDQQALRTEIILDEISGTRPGPPLEAVSSADLQIDHPPAGRHRRNSQQLNMRLTAAEHAALSDAARTVGLKPTQLARTFVLNGTRRLLYEVRSREEA